MTETSGSYQVEPGIKGRFDPSSETWIYIKDRLERAIEAARLKNDQHMSHEERLKLVERIAAYRYVLHDIGREKRPEQNPPENSWNLEAY